jgi:hypothetical protein
VHLEGSFVASEFSATSTSNVNINLVGASVGSRGAGLLGPSIGASAVNLNTNTASAQTQDVSVATMSMTAQILPKPVTALPKPPLVFKGPSLALSIAKAPEVVLPALNPIPNPPPATDPPYLELRRAVIMCQLTDINNATNTTTMNKTIAIDGGGLDWGVTDSGGATVASGPNTGASTTTSAFYITVSRTAPSSTEAKKDYVIRASLNLVNATLSLSL